MEQNINNDRIIIHNSEPRITKETHDIDYNPSGGCCILLLWILFLVISLALIIGLSVGLSDKSGSTIGYIGLISIPICLFAVFAPASLITLSPNK